MKRHSYLLLGTLLILVLVFIGTSCSRSKGADNKLHLYNWTYYTPDEIVSKFKEETGIEIVIDNFASNEEMFAKIMAGGNHGYDIIFPSSDYTSIMITKDLLMELDHSKLPNLKYIDPLVKEKAPYDSTFKYSVPYFMGSSGIAVNKTRVPADYERSWNIFADERIKGRMSLLDDMREVMGAALMYLGYDGNSTNEAELDEATDLIINKWKPNIVKFDSESFGKAFSRNEFYVVHAYAENVFLEVSPSTWDDIDFFVPEGGGMMYIDNMVIPKGARNVEAAHKFINFIHEPENYAIFLDDFFFPPTTNTGAAEFMENDIFFFTSDDLVYSSNLSDLGADLDLYNSRWQKIRYEH
jgi:spermidine/putrescine transport system substrate-binding protein